MKKLWLGAVTLLLVFPLFLPIGTASDLPFANVPFDVNSIPEPAPPPKEVRDFFDLDPFYQQWINVEGYPVLASAKVSPYAVKETAWQIKQMIGDRTDILKALAEFQQRFTIIAHSELPSDIPELRPHLVPHFIIMFASAVVGHVGGHVRPPLEMRYRYLEVPTLLSMRWRIPSIGFH